MKKINRKWVKELSVLMDSPRVEIRERVRALINSEPFRNPPGSSREEYREWIWSRLSLVAEEGIGKLGIDKALGGEGDAEAFLVAFETMAEGDLSLLIKFGVQFGLFGGSIQNLGRKEHHEKYLRDAMEGTLPGCFAMTEGGHGSNVAGLETTITYQGENDTYLVNTPNEEAGKDYIGNAACHARMASVFGQLVVDGKSHGVHCVLVPVRDEDGNPLPGVRISDDGEKMGLNGIDNGRLWFADVEVPRENLLNRFGGVDEKGEYESQIESESSRFFTMLGTLVGGRVSIGIGALTAAKRALKIAIDHGLERRQFGEEGKPETLLMDYRIHQVRLLPRLAKTYAIHFALRELAGRYGKAENSTEGRIYERDAAALKAAATWHATDTIQECREACGGAGYLSEMGFTDLKADTDIFATFEGDNTVLQLLVARELLKDFGRRIKKGGPVTAAFDFLFLYLRKFELAATLIFGGKELSTMTLGRLLKQRESFVLLHLVLKLRKRMKAGGLTPTAAFNMEGPLLAKLAKAHSDLIIYDRFREALSTVNSQKVRVQLEALLVLYGLTEIDADKAWFVENNFIALSRSRAFGDLISAKVGEIRKTAGPLGDALNPWSCQE